MLEGNQAALFAERQKGALPGELSIEWTDVSNGHAAGGFTVSKRHMASNGFLHAASVVALVDTACGYGCVAPLPEGASGFTSIEIRTSYLGAATIGEQVACKARLLHGGRMTQVWDAEATNLTTGKIMAVFRCTQMVLYPR
jgi:1,4-dihydroxy-2-naphthoyl-CoA hydrolase